TLGFVTWNNDPTDYFGSSTEEAVKEFQEAEGLPVSGIIEPNTRDRLEELATGPLSYGMYREDAVALKENLNKLGFTSFNGPNDYFGSETEQGVEDLQSYYGLEITGVANEATVEKIEEILSSPFQEGKSHEDSVELKENLETLGFVTWNNDPTDYFGSSTEEAVKEFQEAEGLPVSGIIEPNTRDRLEELATGPLSYGMYREDAVTLKENLNKLGFTSFNGPNDYFGPETEQGVEDLQSYYGLEMTGVANEAMLEKIEAILSSPFQDGKSHGESVELKENLETLGLVTWNNDPTDYFGSRTEDAVKEFQEYYGLPISGIAEGNTRDKIQEILSSPLQYGKSHEDSVELKENLETLGFVTWNNDPTDYFGSRTEQAVIDFRETYDLPVSGIADKVTLETLEELTKASRYAQYDLTLNESVDTQMNANPQTDQNYAYVSGTYIENGTVTASALNVRSGPGTSYGEVGMLYNGDTVNILDEVGGWYAIEYNGSSQWVTATPDDVFFYLNPDNFVNDEQQRFQFLDLSRTSSASVDMLNDYLEGKGTLEGHGQAFKNASEEHGVSDIYLISHATLETGNGGSALAQGVTYDGETVYNMFGIGANDSCALICGAERAYEEGWFTPYDAIVGGAEFIGNNYIKAGQNTLYEMRWNPEAMDTYGYASHQYATDIGWASKQVNTMYNMYQELGLNTLDLEIPVYQD
ncbi:peptidoglycan-binding protein, partial [Lentibacillus salicampi]